MVLLTHCIFLAKGGTAPPQHSRTFQLECKPRACAAVLVPVMPVQAKGDARGGQHVKMCPAWHLGTPGMSRNREPREL